MNVKHIPLTTIAVALLSSPALALPALQLGPGDGDWTYDNVTQTWTTDTTPFSLFAYANSDTVGADGDFAWDEAGASDLYAYLSYRAYQ